MDTRVEIIAGICGFQTKAQITGNDDQTVHLAIESDCKNIQNLARQLKTHEPIDSFSEIDPSSQSVILTTARECLKGGCAGCVVPSGLFKGMQVAAGLALPKDISLKITQE